MSRSAKKSSVPHNPRYNMTWTEFHRHDVINEFIDELSRTYEWVKTVSIGKSYEGRDMRVIQIAKAGPGAPNVWVEAGTLKSGRIYHIFFSILS